jgi:hypothetical protein
MVLSWEMIDLSTSFQVPDAGVWMNCFCRNAEAGLKKMKGRPLPGANGLG